MGKRKIYYVLYTISIALLFLWALRIDLVNMDDTFTLRMLQHPIPEIIKLDSLDVHPPLYYIILKIFFDITFISHASPYVQIIVGRLFNVLIFFITLVVMKIILNKLSNRRFSIAFLSLVILFPTVLWHTTDIRMYGLSAFFISCELNAIINYNRNQKLKDIILATIFAALGAWTHYFTAVIAGLLLFYNFIMEKHKRLSYCISGIAFFSLFIPWLKISMNQISSVKHSYWIKNQIGEYFNAFVYQKLGRIFGSGFSFCFSILFISCLIYIAVKTLKNFGLEFEKYYMMVSVCLYGTILLGIILSVLIRPIFLGRYVYGISLIYFIMTLPLVNEFIIDGIMSRKDKLCKYGIILLIGIGSVLNMLFGVFYDLRGIKIYQEMESVERSSNKVIVVDHYKSRDVPLMNSFLVQNKIFVIKDYTKISDTGTCQSRELFRNIYPNIKSKR